MLLIFGLVCVIICIYFEIVLCVVLSNAIKTYDIVPHSIRRYLHIWPMMKAGQSISQQIPNDERIGDRCSKTLNGKSNMLRQ